MSLSPEQIERHKRHILLKEIGGPGVGKLQAANVSIIGAGALGGPCALYLAAAGVGHIHIYDDDRIERSNLQRQIQFDEAEIGQAKADRLVRRLKAINPATECHAHAQRVSETTRLEGSILIDATDNFPSRFLLNRLAHQSGRYLVSGAISRWTGQLSVFASGIVADSPCYQCFIPQAPPDAEACHAVGVVGALTGMIGSMMALETIKLIVQAGEPLIGRLCLVDGLSCQVRTLGLRPDPACSVCQI